MSIYTRKQSIAVNKFIKRFIVPQFCFRFNLYIAIFWQEFTNCKFGLEPSEKNFLLDAKNKVDN